MAKKTLKRKTLKGIAKHFRNVLKEKDFILLFAYNGTGKTRLSMEFKNLGKQGDSRDTLYFNAFTEDLFTWENDLDNDTERFFKINKTSRFFNVFTEGIEIESRIKKYLHRYSDFDFKINYEEEKISFSRSLRRVVAHNREETKTIENIKISRGEENLFIWSFFLAIAELAIDGQESYNWVKYIFIDDPISSLDDNNAVTVAGDLAYLLKNQERIKVIITSHHTLFFNVMYNELQTARKYFFNKENNEYVLHKTNDTPRFYHVAMLKELHKAARTGELYTYHFTILRSILEKTAAFHGFSNYSALIKKDPNDVDGLIHARIINLLSHGNYSIFEPVEMLEENKKIFSKILKNFMNDYTFNPEFFPEEI